MANQPTQTFYTRIQNKHDVATAWANSTLIPYAGEIIVYDPEGNQTNPRFKIGDGNKTVPNLPFADDNALTRIGTSLAQLQLGAEGQKTTLSYGDTKISEVTVPFATAATTANKLSNGAGLATQPVYFPTSGDNAGKPVAIGYTIQSNVPDGAIFTDEKVKKASDIATETALPLLFGSTASGTTAETVKFNSNIAVIPKTNTIKATTFDGTAKQVGKNLKVGSKTYNGSAEVEILASDLGLQNAMHFRGTVTTLPTTTSGYANGDVILVTGTSGSVRKEYVCSDSTWVELGDEGSYVVKTRKLISATGITISNQGTLDQDVTIGHADTSELSGAQSSSGKHVSSITVDGFGHVTAVGYAAPPTIPNISISGNDETGNVITGMTASGHTITVTKGSFATQGDFTSLKGKAVDGISSGSANGTIKYSVNGVNKGDVAVTGLKSAAYTESSAYAPASHVTVSATGSVLGHVKLSDSADATKTAATGGWAATPAAVAAVDQKVSGLNLATLNENTAATWVLFNCGTSTSVL